MKRVFCYYRKSINFVNFRSTVQSTVHQDRVLYNYCVFKNLYVVKRFSDLGYRGSPYTRPELLQMRRTLEKPNFKVDLLILYSIEAIKKETKNNEALLLEVIKQIGEVHFFKENLTMTYERFRVYLEGLGDMKLSTFEQTLTHTYEKKENA